MQTLIVILIVAVCCLYLGRRLYKRIKTEPSSCSYAGGCDSCTIESPDCEPPDCDKIKDS
jgi:hypothetical protein